MEYRHIRPSVGGSSASSSNPSQATSESTGSGQRRRGGEKEVPESSTSSSKRRRVPESVTRNACLNCKKARAKCDGKKPCKRCTSRVEASECIYEIHIKHAKEELVKQIKELKAKDQLTDQILQALSTEDDKVPEILERLRDGEGREEIVEWLGRSPTEEIDTLSPKESSLHSAIETSDHEMGGTSPTNLKWTYVTSNHSILDHLFQLYFAWVHPVHTLFHEGRFVDCYKRQSDQYCSSVLVNAICAMACHLHSAEAEDEMDFEQLGGDFSDAVGMAINANDKSITTTQAFAVMFLVDCARSKSLRASSYLKVASNSLPNIEYQAYEGFQEVWMKTVRGIQQLNAEWAQMTYQIPPNVTFAPYGDIEEIDDKMDAARWYFYRFVNEPCDSWPGFMATINREKSKLTSLIQEMIIMMYSQRGTPITARNIVEQYSRFIYWHRELPSQIGNIEKNSIHVLPHMLSLLILYSTALVHLLRPLLDLEGFHPSQVEETACRHAQQGLLLLDMYKVNFSCRYQPVLQMFSILHLTSLVARYSPGGTEGLGKDGPEAIQTGMEALMQSREGFPVAGPLQEMLRRTANECSIRLPADFSQIVFAPKPPKQFWGMDDLIDACTRPTYAQPIEEVHRRYSPSFSLEWAIDGANFEYIEAAAASGSPLGFQTAEERGAQSLMQIRNLLNTG